MGLQLQGPSAGLSYGLVDKCDHLIITELQYSQY